MKNRYGVDVDYFTKELARLGTSLDNRTPGELARYLRTLANIAEPDTTRQVYGRPVQFPKLRFVFDNNEYSTGIFLRFADGYEYADGRNPMPITHAFVELPDGRVVECHPTDFKFVNEKPEPLADGPGS